MPAQIEKDELLEAIRKDGPYEVVKQYRHNLLPSRTLIDLYSEHPERDILLFLALYPTVPSQVLEDLADAVLDPEIQAAAATNPRCTHLLLIRMAREGGPAVRAALAANKLQNSKITAELINDPNLSVRSALAGNPAIQDNYRVALALDPEPAVRTALSSTPKLPEEIIHTLSADASPVVRAATFAYAKTTSEMIQSWANSTNPEAQRLILARNKLPPETIQALSLSSDAYVQNAIKDTYQPTESDLLARAESEDEATRIETAAHPELPPEIQYILASDPNEEVRIALATNKNLSPKMALQIAASNDTVACAALATHPEISLEAKIELCHHESETVALAMAYRDDLSNELLDILINQRSEFSLVEHLAQRGLVYPEIKHTQIDKILKHQRPSLHTFAANAANLTQAQIRKLSNSPAIAPRLALCKNPALKRADLQQLATDWNKTVADEATKQLEKRTPPPTTPTPPQTATTAPQPAPSNNEETLVSKIVKFFK